jgi:hypothetical protein
MVVKECNNDLCLRESGDWYDYVAAADGAAALPVPKPASSSMTVDAAGSAGRSDRSPLIFSRSLLYLQRQRHVPVSD